MTSDRMLRAGTAAAVLMVALIAAVISYQHLYSLALSHGEPRLDAALIPLAIDGTVITASLLMLRASRAGRSTPWLARTMLFAAVAMTVAANVAFGWHYAAWGVLMAGFPAAAFLGNAEATIMYGHENVRAAGEAAPGPPAGLAQVAQDAEQAAHIALAASVAAGNPLSQRQLMTRFGISRTAERKVRTDVAAASNGHVPE